MPQITVTGDMIPPQLGRNIRYWYTYRTAVAVVAAVALTILLYGIYTQEAPCDAHDRPNCHINIAVHPEDRLFSESAPDSNIVIVGIDNKSIQRLNEFPVPRSFYALALRNLESAGVAVVAFDVNFPDRRDSATDANFAMALRTSTVPVVLSYGGQDTIPLTGRFAQTSSGTSPEGVDQMPLKEFWCADANSATDKGPCQQPDKSVLLASTDIVPDADGVVRKMPMFVEPACHSAGRCSTPVLNPLSFTAYRVFSLLPDFASGPTLQESGQSAAFGSAWQRAMPLDGNGATLINYTIAPGRFQNTSHYLSFADVYSGSFDPAAVKGKIVLIGAYYLTGVHDEVLTPAASGTPMPGVELHANVLNMLLPAQPRFVMAEPPLLLFLIMLVLALATAIGISRVTVVWGFAGTIAALAVFTVAMSALSVFVGWVPDLFHPWLAIALTYTGVTAYRFLYEDREKRKVTALFGQYLKPAIVAELAKDRRGVEGILRGGERRDLTCMFVDIRGFTAMSESMAPSDVTDLVQLYLDDLSAIVFTWDGTLDKYVGDEIVAFWNAPRMQQNHALLALRCAYDLINRAPQVQEKLLAKGLPPIRWGIGINTGPAVVGMMGSRSRLQYTALGDTVNTAARFCAHAPAFHVLIGHETYEMCKDYIAVELVPGVQLKGKSAEKFTIYQLTAIRETPQSQWVQFPTQMATNAHLTFTSQFTQKTVMAAANAGSTDILVGDAARELLQVAGEKSQDGDETE